VQRARKGSKGKSKGSRALSLGKENRRVDPRSSVSVRMTSVPKKNRPKICGYRLKKIELKVWEELGRVQIESPREPMLCLFVDVLRAYVVSLFPFPQYCRAFPSQTEEQSSYAALVPVGARTLEP